MRLADPSSRRPDDGQTPRCCQRAVSLDLAIISGRRIVSVARGDNDRPAPAVMFAPLVSAPGMLAPDVFPPSMLAPLMTTPSAVSPIVGESRRRDASGHGSNQPGHHQP